MAGLLTGQSAIITGAASGLGAACARLFADEGARLVLVDVNEGALSGVCCQIPGSISVVGSVSDEATAQRAVGAAIAGFGGVNVLVNNAAIDPLSAGSVSNTSVDDWDRVIAVNLRGAFLFARAVLPSMVAQGSGVLVHTASISAIRPTPDEAAYCVSKAALVQLSRSIALDYAAKGIRSNTVCPGFLEAVMSDRAGSLTNEQRADRSATASRIVPLGREGRYSEIANAVLFLASASAGYVTGTTLTVDGGMTLG
jgi:NAD(P)-dependent dehydrogenase (short-subunit alcohol dehydrogenase family)